MRVLLFATFHRRNRNTRTGPLRRGPRRRILDAPRAKHRYPQTYTPSTRNTVLQHAVDDAKQSYPQHAVDATSRRNEAHSIFLGNDRPQFGRRVAREVVVG